MDLPMPVRRLYAHPRVRMDVGRVALSRGPLVYCIEQHDNGDTPVTELRLPRDAEVDGRGAERSPRRDHGADGEGRRAQGERLERRASTAPRRRPSRRRR